MLSPLLKKLIFARQFSVENGEIQLIQLRNMLISPDLILKLQEVNATRLYEISKKVMKKDLDFLRGKISLEGQGNIQRLEELYELFGFGNIKIVDLDRKKKRGVVNIHNSPIARTYLLNNKASKEPKCNFIAGKIAGMFCFIFRKNVDAKEVKCLSKGDDFCQFIVK